MNNDRKWSFQSLAIRDIVRDSLEKDPVDRTEDDIDILLQFTQHLEAFNRYTMAVRRALCSGKKGGILRASSNFEKIWDVAD